MPTPQPRGTLAIVVGGGPAPGINGVISAVTIEAIESEGFEVIGIMDGFKHLIKGDATFLDCQLGAGAMTFLGAPHQVDWQRCTFTGSNSANNKLPFVFDGSGNFLLNGCVIDVRDSGRAFTTDRL